MDPPSAKDWQNNLPTLFAPLHTPPTWTDQRLELERRGVNTLGNLPDPPAAANLVIDEDELPIVKQMLDTKVHQWQTQTLEESLVTNHFLPLVKFFCERIDLPFTPGHNIRTDKNTLRIRQTLHRLAIRVKNNRYRRKRRRDEDGSTEKKKDRSAKRARTNGDENFLITLSRKTRKTRVRSPHHPHRHDVFTDARAEPYESPFTLQIPPPSVFAEEAGPVTIRVVFQQTQDITEGILNLSHELLVPKDNPEKLLLNISHKKLLRAVQKVGNDFEAELDAQRFILDPPILGDDSVSTLSHDRLGVLACYAFRRGDAPIVFKIMPLSKTRNDPDELAASWDGPKLPFPVHGHSINPQPSREREEGSYLKWARMKQEDPLQDFYTQPHDAPIACEYNDIATDLPFPASIWTDNGSRAPLRKSNTPATY